MITLATLTVEVRDDFEPPRTITFSPPPDHPAVLDLLKWNDDRLLALAKAAAPGDLFTL